jgi:redox-sensitive bicupin YhaK (pirin superfamily)
MAAAELTPNSRVTRALAPGRAAWLHVVRGEVELNGQVLRNGDSAAVQAEESLEIVGTGTQNAEVLLFDLA